LRRWPQASASLALTEAAPELSKKTDGAVRAVNHMTGLILMKMDITTYQKRKYFNLLFLARHAVQLP
jgi:hypothetical protein